MPWLNIVDEQMIGVLGGVAANNHIPEMIGADYAITTEVRYVIANSAEKSIKLTLPDPAKALGYDLVVKVTDASNAVEICPYDAEKIDGAPQTIKLDVDYSYVRLVSDGVDWYIIG
nr:hypothetical protein [Candidatus Cloacimonadota bacterium]